MEQFDTIRRLLNEVAAHIEATEPAPTPYSGAEIETLVRDVVDLLQPQLSPYAAAFYWYMLRHSIIEDGSSHIRIGTRGLQSGVVKSARSGQVSQGQVQEVLSQLEQIGAVRKEGEPNRGGTLYRILTPNEIPACEARRLESVDPPVRADFSEIDFYNVRDNRIKIYERDSFDCQYCHKKLTLYTATLDHVVPAIAGGDNSFDNLVTSCLRCNSIKTSRPIGDFLIDR